MLSGFCDLSNDTGRRRQSRVADDPVLDPPSRSLKRPNGNQQIHESTDSRAGFLRS